MASSTRTSLRCLWFSAAFAGTIALSVCLVISPALLKVPDYVISPNLREASPFPQLAAPFRIAKPNRTFRFFERVGSNGSSTSVMFSAPNNGFLFSLIIFAGDVESNPGPPSQKGHIKFPCGECTKPVKSNQAGILCDTCNSWFHARCVGLSGHMYDRLTPDDEWICPNCALKGFFLDSSMDSSPDSQDPPTTHPYKPHPASIKGLSFLLSNVRSIRGKIPDLHALTATTSIDILALTETWLCPDVFDSELLPNEFAVFRADRNTIGGGVLLAVNHALNPVKISASEPNLPFELMAVSCRTRSRKVLLICVYSPPAADLERMEALCRQLNALADIMSTHDLTLLLGDFNLPDISWSPHPIPRTHVSELFIDTTTSLGLSQYVLEPTRQSNILDLVFADNPRLIDGVQVTDNLPNCDHHAVSGNLVLPSRNLPSPKRTFYSYDKTDVAELSSKLDSVPWNLALDEPDIDSAWTLWKDLFLTTIHDSIPNRTCRSNRRNPWISPAVIHASHVKRNLFRLAKSKNTAAAWAKLKHHNNLLRQMTRTARDTFLKSLHADLGQSPKRFWSYLKSKTRISPPSSFLSASGHTLSGGVEITEEFNSFFHNCFTKSNPICSIAERVFEPNPSNPELCEIVISPAEVHEAIRFIKPDGACGPDGITPKMLKLSGHAICAPLAKLFNKSLETGLLPSEWKTAFVVPIFKGGPNRSDISAYRPISLTSIVGKLLERIICRKMSSFSNQNNLLPDSQFGFREKRSTTLQLVQSFHSWASSLDSPLPPDIHIIFLDWAKAFDSVPHDLLILKLRGLGFSGNLLRWIANFLTDRSQCVVHNGAKSSHLPVISGVPQGSVLGPLLFTLYISDLPAALSSLTSDSQFADDCYLHRAVTCPSDSRLLQNDVNAVVAWGEVNKLKLNPKKCQSLTLTRRPFPFQYIYHICDHPIPTVSSVKVLGIYLQSDLKWRSHITSITSKAYSIMGLIRRTFGRTPGALSAFKAICLPLLEYAAPVWNPHLNQDCAKLERVQRSFTNFMLCQSSFTANSPDHIQYEDRLTRLHLKSLSSRREVASLVLLFKMLHHRIDIDLNHFASLNLRHLCPTFLVKFARCNALKYSFFFHATKIWNSLPLSIRSLTSLNSFKNAMKKHA